MTEALPHCPMEPHPWVPQAAALPWSPFFHLTEGVPFTASSCVENEDEVLKVHQNPCPFPPSFSVAIYVLKTKLTKLRSTHSFRHTWNIH